MPSETPPAAQSSPPPTFSRPHYAYVLWSPSSRLFYIGTSSAPASRLAHHNRNSKSWTSRHRPWRLVWQSPALSPSAALALERRLKSQHRGRGFLALTSLNPAGYRPNQPSHIAPGPHRALPPL